MFDLTTIIVIVTAIVSISAFSNQKLINDLIFYPPSVQRGQYYRFITHGFIHADWVHLIFNMLAFYSFGANLETVFVFDCVFGRMGKVFFLLLYFSSFVVASLPDYFKFKDSYHFRSLGASGAVSAIVFSLIIFFPQSPVGLIFIPGIQIPGYIFAILYLGISVYLDKRGGGNINHSAHFWGAAYGIVFTLLFCQVFASNFDVYDNFKTQIKSASEQLVLICDF